MCAEDALCYSASMLALAIESAEKSGCERLYLQRLESRKHQPILLDFQVTRPWVNPCTVFHYPSSDIVFWFPQLRGLEKNFRQRLLRRRRPIQLYLTCQLAHAIIVTLCNKTSEYLKWYIEFNITRHAIVRRRHESWIYKVFNAPYTLYRNVHTRQNRQFVLRFRLIKFLCNICTGRVFPPRPIPTATRVHDGKPYYLLSLIESRTARAAFLAENGIAPRASASKGGKRYFLYDPGWGRGVLISFAFATIRSLSRLSRFFFLTSWYINRSLLFSFCIIFLYFSMFRP